MVTRQVTKRLVIYVCFAQWLHGVIRTEAHIRLDLPQRALFFCVLQNIKSECLRPLCDADKSKFALEQ